MAWMCLTWRVPASSSQKTGPSSDCQQGNSSHLYSCQAEVLPLARIETTFKFEAEGNTEGPKSGVRQTAQIRCGRDAGDGALWSHFPKNTEC